jgi:hypothetical protein
VASVLGQREEEELKRAEGSKWELWECEGCHETAEVWL